MQTNLIDNTIKELMDSGAEAGIALHDGTILTGRLTDFDGYVVVLGTELPVIVYRHSILKITTSAAIAKKPAPERPRPQQARTEKPATERPRQTPARAERPASQPARQTPRRPQERKQPRPSVQEKPAASTQDDFKNPMAEKMAIWLKGQKGQ